MPSVDSKGGADWGHPGFAVAPHLWALPSLTHTLPSPRHGTPILTLVTEECGLDQSGRDQAELECSVHLEPKTEVESPSLSRP